MSSQITTAFVKQYGANIYNLVQQKGSRLRMAVRNEMQTGDSQFFERVGAVTAILKSSRHADTPQIDTPHSRRRVTLADYEWADLIDKADKIRLLIDPASTYVQAAIFALGRAMDDVIIAAATGSAYSGVDGGTAVVCPLSQMIHSVASSALSTLNVQALRLAKKTLDAAEADPSIPRYFICKAAGIHALLGQTEVTSSDYNSVKALVAGDIDTFLGFKFIRSERLLTSTDTTRKFNLTTGAYDSGGTSITSSVANLAFAKDGLLLAVGQDMVSRISERADKSYSIQAYASMGIGATRMEEEKLVVVHSV